MSACEEQVVRASAERGDGAGLAREPGGVRSETDEWAALLTEELRTDLQTLLGFTQLIERDHKEPLPQRQRERVRRVHEAGERLLRVLDDASALWRIQSRQVPLVIQAVDVHRVFQRVRQELEPCAVSRKLELRTAGSSPGAPQVLADAGALTEILLKLGANAIAYNKPHGSLSFQVSPLAFARFRISVVDTGLGIPLEEQQKLFRPFPRVARPTPCAVGAGLGLVTCRRLAGQMGGDMGFHSIPDRGSEFWVNLPAYRTP